jgi:hypothetical protein
MQSTGWWKCPKNSEPQDVNDSSAPGARVGLWELAQAVRGHEFKMQNISCRLSVMF